MRSGLMTERTISYGQHVYVLSDLSLSPSSSPEDLAITRLCEFLGEIDDAATVVVAGNFFALGERPLEDIAATWAALPQLRDAITAFVGVDHHHLVLLPGVADAALATDGAVLAHLGELGVEVAPSLDLTLEASEGPSRVTVTSGTTPRLDTSTDVPRLDDPSAAPRYISSRTLYRRFAPALWTGLAAVAGFDLFNTATRIYDLATHHHYVGHAPHTHTFAGNVMLNLLVLVVLEAAIVTAVSRAARRRFRWRHHDESSFSEPLAETQVGDVSAIDAARSAVTSGARGMIVGGAARLALAYLDDGFCASPGPSSRVVTEYEAALNLPSVFREVERFSLVTLDVGADVRVSVAGHQSSPDHGTLLERLVARAPVQPGLPEQASEVGAWPNGQPFPANLEGLTQARRQRSVRRWASGLLLLDGVVNILVTASPPLRERLSHVLKYLPLGTVQSAAVLTAVAGVAMIMLARGIRRGQRRAWYVAEATLALTVVSHVVRAGSLASSVVAASIFTFLLIRRKDFAALTDRTSLTAALPRVLLIAALAVLTAALSLEVAARHNHAYVLPSFGAVLAACAERLVGIYATTLPDRPSDFINPVLLVIGVTLFVGILYVITRPVVDRRLSTSGNSAERHIAELRARDIVRRHGRGTLDYFALRDDKQFFFWRDSLVAYAVYGGVALVSPDPIGPDVERAGVFSAFRAFAESRGWTIAIVAAASEWLPTYHAAGFHSLYLGDEAIVDCQNFSLEGGKMKGLRQACTRLAKHGYSVEFVDPATIAPRDIMGILDLVAMMRRGDDERGFAMMLGRLFDPKDKGLLMTIVRGPDGKPAAACQFVPAAAIKGYSLDLMRRDPGEHPNGLIDYALCSTIAHLASIGATGLSLNFAAFRGVLDGERGEGTWTRVERWTLHRLSGVLPIASLWTFNAKYQPRWLPRHLAYPALESFVPVVSAILRAESLTEIPGLGRLLANDPANRPGTVIPPDVLEAAKRAQVND